MKHYHKIYHQLLKELRHQCDALGLQEVRTAIMTRHPPYEPHIKSFSVLNHRPYHPPQKFYLRSSPECAMKQLIAIDKEDIYQIAPVFRNHEDSPLHSAEFTMLEWYRCHKNDHDIMNECEAIIKRTAASLAIENFRHNDMVIPIEQHEQPWQRLSMRDAFKEFAQMDILATIDHPLTPSSSAIREQAHMKSIATTMDDGWEDIFFRIFYALVEPHLGVSHPIFLTDYPSPLSLLARLHDDEPLLSHRFELFIARVELANGYEELTGEDANRQRLATWNETHDESFLKAMADLPPVTGMALGIERLLLLLTDSNAIEWR